MKERKGRQEGEKERSREGGRMSEVVELGCDNKGMKCRARGHYVPVSQVG